MAERYAAGESVADIARRYKCSSTTVKNAARAHGVTREQAVEQVRAAAETARERNARRREELQADALSSAVALVGRLSQPYLVYGFGGAEFGFASRELDEPPAQDAKNLATAAQALVRTALDLARFEAESAGGQQSRALIEQLASGLEALAGDPAAAAPGEGEC